MKNKLFIDLLPIESERLILNKTTKEDISLLLKLDNQRLTQKYLGGIKNKTKEERLEFLEKKENKWNNNIVSSMTVYLKNNTKIGFINLTINEYNNYGIISYLFDQEYWNNGYCTESCKKIIDICFDELNIDYIKAEVVEGNNSSIRVLEKLGFQLSNVRKEEAYIEELKEYKDFYDYELRRI